MKNLSIGHKLQRNLKPFIVILAPIHHFSVGRDREGLPRVSTAWVLCGEVAVWSSGQASKHRILTIKVYYNVCVCVCY